MTLEQIDFLAGVFIVMGFWLWAMKAFASGQYIFGALLVSVIVLHVLATSWSLITNA